MWLGLNVQLLFGHWFSLRLLKQAFGELKSRFEVYLSYKGSKLIMFEAIYQRQQGEILWVTVLWMIARINVVTSHPHPQRFRSIVVVLEAEPLKGMSPHTPLHVPRVGESQVHGPSLSRADVTKEQEHGVCLWLFDRGTRSRHSLLAHAEPLPELGRPRVGKAALLYQRTQHAAQSPELLT